MSATWAEQLAGDRAALSSGSRAERLADVLRERIIQGLFRPGERLSEEELSAALSVSRNTLREAFRQLGQEGVLVHEFGRGVFVRTLSMDDVRDIYTMRRILELAAVRNLPNAPDGALEAVRLAVENAEKAAARADWFAVGTANMHFHQAVSDLTGSRRVHEAVRRLLAELRLVFVVMADLREFHKPYLTSNRELYELLAAGDVDAAQAALTAYLDSAEAKLLDEYARRTG
jgi:DNA-binding GntR family transcriptional regulator